MRNRFVIPSGIFVLVLVLISGCTRTSHQNKTAVAKIGLTTIPFPAVMGDTRLVLHVTDQQDQPINNAELSIKGDMSHAGMVPILTKATSAENGYYEVPIMWTMSGDWRVQVEAHLADGTVAKQHFDLRVLTEDELCTSDHK